MLADVTGNYPPGTWNADPRAPWNEPDPWAGRSCGECASCVACRLLGGSEVRVCAADVDQLEEVDPSRPAEDCFEGVARGARG